MKLCNENCCHRNHITSECVIARIHGDDAACLFSEPMNPDEMARAWQLHDEDQVYHRRTHKHDRDIEIRSTSLYALGHPARVRYCRDDD